MDKPDLGEFLATLRKECGYTQQDVADKLNISDRTLSSWETGRTEPDLSSLAALADFYGLTVDEILRGERNAELHSERADEQPDESEDPLEKFSRKRNICVAVGVISALVFIVGSLTLLLTEAPLWLDLLFILAGGGGNIASLVLLFRFENQTLGDDAENELKLNLKHSASFALILNSLAYICGAIVLFICFFTTNIYYFSDQITDVLVWLGEFNYDFIFAVFILVCTIVGFILLTAGVLRINISAKYLGNARQKSAAKYNVKLFKRLCGFGAIPVALSFVFFIIFSVAKFSVIDEVYFTANGVDELRKTFQTLTFEVDQTYSEDGTVQATIPAGEYYFSFEKRDYVVCTIVEDATKFYDLGNGFYGAYYNNGVNICYLKDGISPNDEDYRHDYREFFVHVVWGHELNSTSPDGERLTICAVAYSYSNDRREWSHGYSDLYYSAAQKVLTRGGSVYTYQRIVYYDYSPLAGLILGVVSTATVLTCTAVHLVKRKKIK